VGVGDVVDPSSSATRVLETRNTPRATHLHAYAVEPRFSSWDVCCRYRESFTSGRLSPTSFGLIDHDMGGTHRLDSDRLRSGQEIVAKPFAERQFRESLNTGVRQR
jgi:hypothetical protein